MEPRKATHEQLRRHNKQMLLRSIYLGLAQSRAALAQMTGLTKPTVSSLVSELIDDGLLLEGGHGPASESGGKRPRILEFQPEARQVIGICVDHEYVSGVLTDLYGRVVAHHLLELGADRPLEQIGWVIDGLRAQLDAPLLCIGIGLPGEIDSASGSVRRSAVPGWQGLEVGGPLQESYGRPVHVAHGTELSALAQYAFDDGAREGDGRLATLLVDGSVEFGVTLERGAVHYGGDLGSMRMAVGTSPPPSLSRLLGSQGELSRRIRILLGQEGSGSVDYLGLQYAALAGDDQARALVRELIQALAPVVIWAVSLLRPRRLTLAGPVTELGSDFLLELQRECSGILPDEVLAGVEFALAHSLQTGALGAVALALQKELGLV